MTPDAPGADPGGWLARARELDSADPLAAYADRFLEPVGEPLVGYLDGNSLGRPPAETARRLADFVAGPWGTRLIRGWTEDWMDWPTELGDRLGAAALGAGAGQTVVADSTSVLLYKLARAAVDLGQPGGRAEVVVDTENFPTDRYLLEGIAAERGLTLRWVQTDADGGIEADQVAEAVGERTALVLLSHVAYRSGHLADAERITRVVHDAGALILWDLSHSVGSVPVELDRWGVDLAVGCTYKYLCGGPGAPAFAYVRRSLQDRVQQPIWGWMGRRDVFAMGQGYQPAEGIRRVLTGTPPILAMVPVRAGVDLVADAGIHAIRAKSVLLTGYAVELVDALLAEHGVTVPSPRDSARRGGHLTIRRPGFRAVNARLWELGVLPDFREPDSIRLGLAPLSTRFVEVYRSVRVLADLLGQRSGG